MTLHDCQLLRLSDDRIVLRGRNGNGRSTRVEIEVGIGDLACVVRRIRWIRDRLARDSDTLNTEFGKAGE